jgi:Double zinc ribbon
MTDQIPCSRCRHANPPENRFCGWCGASLRTSTDLLVRREGGLTVMGHALPVKPGPIGTALAVGLCTLALRAGMFWLRHRITADDRSSTLTTREHDTALSEYLLHQGMETILIQESGEAHQGRTIAWQAIRSIAAERFRGAWSSGGSRASSPPFEQKR